MFIIEQEDEKEFILEDIIDEKNDEIYIKTKSYVEVEKANLNAIIVMCEDTKIIELQDVELNTSLSKVRILSENKISDKYLFLFGKKVIQKEEENNILIINIIDKNNCIYIQSRKEEQNKINLKDNKKEIVNENIQDNLNENSINSIENLKNNLKMNIVGNSEGIIKENIERDNSKEIKDMKVKLKDNSNSKDNLKENLININKNIKGDKLEEIRDLKDNLKENSNEIIKENQNNTLNYYLNKLESLSVFFKNFLLSPLSKNNTILKEYNYFIENYEQFKGIKRFSIPIFGIISSGKSTLLNYLLNLDNILEMDEDTSTQFICIIRNKKGLKKPKLYNVKLECRDKEFKFYQFLKDKEVEGEGDIKTKISNQNKLVRESKINRNNPEDFFLLIEVEIPFLNESDKDFGDLFEFMDFPGLNEGEINNDNKLNLFYKDYLPLIIPNIIFPIFICELSKYEGEESINIIKYYKEFSTEFNHPELEKICYKSYEKAVFILNKSDKLKSEEKKKNSN